MPEKLRGAKFCRKIVKNILNLIKKNTEKKIMIGRKKIFMSFFDFKTVCKD